MKRIMENMFTPLVAALLAWRTAHPEAPFPLPGSGLVCLRSRQSLHEVVLPRLSAVLVLHGEKWVFAGGACLAFPAGSVFVLPPGVPCTVENIPHPGTGQYTALCLGFEATHVARACLGAQNMPAQEQPRQGQGSRVAIAVPVGATLAGAFTHLVQSSLLLPSGHPAHSLCLEAILTLLVAQEPGVCQLPVGNSIMQRCLLLASMAPGRKWTAQDMAGHLAVSERSLRRHLQDEGTSLRAVLLSARLNTALGMLQGGLGNVGEVAGRCGYDSPSRFAAQFRVRFGMSPAEVLRCNASALSQEPSKGGGHSRLGA
ncbi:helix-turn-helix domain-containing protein [Desulfovibrio cuneatus]|uniref:helix-turn-helix domain-containing protein n=1 Tax=Desulfovibrio cuneatus TaxID=159728 RepID=UPI00041073E0|nr:helix-turn-helix domain-containing protein [Desulfovibrio cuneatus]